MDERRRERLRAQLRSAERRLAAAERQQINVASQSSYGGGWDSGPEDRQNTRALNERMAESAGVDELRAEIGRLREELGHDADASAPSFLERISSRLRSR